MENIYQMSARITLPVFLVLYLATTAFSQNVRYLDRVFASVGKTANVVYANAPALNYPYFSENSTTNTDLNFDIFQPTGDTATARPFILFIHSGAFLNGSKENEDMQALSDSFAHRGYVTATMNYRKGFNLLSSTSAERAVYRGLQDAAAAIRFIKQFRTTYKIDTAHIFSVGSSAGGFSALNLAYMDNSERPASTYSGPFRPDLGCVDCAGNSYPHTHTLKAFASCWGAVGNIAWINNNIPAILFHGDADASVPYNEGHPFGYSIFPIVYGSLPINQRLTDQGVLHEFYTGVGEDHEYWGTCNGDFCPAPTPFYSDIIDKTALFFYNQLPAAPLPVSLLSFRADKVGKSIVLTWETATERNACCFEVEHSTNGLDFQTIGKKPAAGNSDLQQHYEFVDATPTDGDHYYRLKQLDLSGNFKYSSMLKIQLDDPQFRIYPNPSTGIIQIGAPETEAIGVVKITNMLGELVWQGSLETDRINLSGQPRGTYLVRIQTEGQLVTRRVILR